MWTCDAVILQACVDHVDHVFCLLFWGVKEEKKEKLNNICVQAIIDSVCILNWKSQPDPWNSMYRARHPALRSVVWRDNFKQIEFWNLRKLSLEFRETSIFVIHHLKALGEMSYFSRKITITIHT